MFNWGCDYWLADYEPIVHYNGTPHPLWSYWHSYVVLPHGLRIRSGA